MISIHKIGYIIVQEKKNIVHNKLKENKIKHKPDNKRKNKKKRKRMWEYCTKVLPTPFMLCSLLKLLCSCGEGFLFLWHLESIYSGEEVLGLMGNKAKKWKN